MHCFEDWISNCRAALFDASVALVCAAFSSVAAAEGYVAGVTPSQRPTSAPKLTKFEKTSAWLPWAARGVSEPRPASLKFLDDQGAWYTPFSLRGMPGRYDIRGLHALPQQAGAAARAN